MAALINKIRSVIRKLLDKGFFHIFIGNTLVKCISLCSAILLPRIIVPESLYGLLSTVDNVNSYLILINGMGLSTSVLRFCAMKNTQKEKTAVFRFCLKIGLLADGVVLLVFIPLLLFSSLFSGGNYGAAKYYILISCLIPLLTYLQDIAMVYMRANLLNKEFSRISVLYTACYAGFQIALALVFSLNGVFIGRYLALSLIVLVGFAMLYRNQVLTREPSPLAKSEKKEILWFGVGAMITNAFSLIMPLNETLVVNLVLKDLATTAYYKAASMVPSNLQYIATSVVVFIFPYFARHTGDDAWIKKNSKRVLLGMCGIMLPIIAVGYWITPQIILLIYGQNYAPAISIMRPMWIAFGINAIVRIPIGNALAALGELKFNIVLSAVISVLHLGLDFLFISQLGIGGAAYALMVSYAVSSLCSIFYLFRNCRGKWNRPPLCEEGEPTK